MRKRLAITAAAIWFCGITAALAADSSVRSGADQQTPLNAPPLSGTTSSDLGRSGGVIAPPADVDPQMRRRPPPSGDSMAVVSPPGTPGGDPSVKPK